MKKIQKKTDKAAVAPTTPVVEKKTSTKKTLYIYPDSTGGSPKKLPKNANVEIDKSMFTNVTPAKIGVEILCCIPAAGAGWSIGKDICNTSNIVHCDDATKKEKTEAVVGCIGKSIVKLASALISSKVTYDMCYDNVEDLRK